MHDKCRIATFAFQKSKNNHTHNDMINLRYLIIILFTLIAVPLTVVAADQEKDTIASRLLQEVRITFNQNDEQRFYDASSAYRNHLLQKGNRPGYYLSWKNEILYDVNHNHFYRALRKTMKMQGEMEERGDKEEFYKVTHLRGIIYSLRGNIPLAHQYFEKALQQVNHAQPANLISLYMDLSNIEMDTQPEEAMKHLNCAIEIIKANGASYEYSDAIGFKVIVAYAMRDWRQVNEAFAEYIQLQETLGENFSTTYYNYALICKATADKRYQDAINHTLQLTNTTDIYKFQTEKFTQQDTITIRTYVGRIDDMICFSVTDTGCGVKEGEEEKIFEHFYKSDAYIEGVGLGLSLARRVARQLGGDVVLDTRYKEGSRFVLKLPKE